MHKSTWIKLGVIALVLLLFAGYTVYLKWDRSHFTVDAKAFDVKESFGEVMDESIEKADGLRLADKFDITDQVDITREFPNKQRNLQIHNVWFTPSQLYVLYSVNLKKEDQAPSDIPGLDFANVTLSSREPGAITLPTIRYDRKEFKQGGPGEVDEMDKADDEGVVFDRRLYRSLVLEPDYEELTGEDIQNFGNPFTGTTHIALEDAALKIDDDKEIMDDLTLEYAYDEPNQTLFTVPLDEDVLLANGDILTVEKLSVAPFVNTLYFSGKSDGSKVRDIDADFTWNKQEPQARPFHGVVKKDDYSTMFMPFELVPEQLDVDIKSVRYAYDKVVSLHIPGPGDVEQEDVPREVGKAKGRTFYFEGYSPSEFDGDSRMELKLKTEKSKQEAGTEFFYPILYQELEKQYEHVKGEESKEAFIDSFSDIITIENEKGEKPSFETDYSDVGEQPNLLMTDENKISIYLDKSFVDQAAELHITVDKLTFSEDVEDGTFRIDIPDEYVSEE